MELKRFALIVAGGSGTRMESCTPKQFIPLHGLPMLMHTVKTFHSLKTIDSIVLVLPTGEMTRWKLLCNEFNFTIPLRLVEGGETRFHSVKNGLASLGNQEGWVAVHDGVRPLVTAALIEKCFNAAQRAGNAIPAIRATDSIRIGQQPDDTSATSRSTIWIVQTPQVFNLQKLKSHYSAPWNENFTDDASVAEANGEKITLVEGERDNIKITTPSDLIFAHVILTNRGEMADK